MKYKSFNKMFTYWFLVALWYSTSIIYEIVVSILIDAHLCCYYIYFFWKNIISAIIILS